MSLSAGELLFVNVPSTEEKIMEFFGISAADLPYMIIADLSKEGGVKKYPFASEAHDLKSITDHANKFLKGTLSLKLSRPQTKL